jgi:predicted nucleic acid-binding protein
VGTRQNLVLIDTNIFVIDLRYKRDIYYQNNLTFLAYIAKKRVGFTTIVNLLELCGILSFNLSEKQLTELWFYFQDRYQVTVLPVPNLETHFPKVSIKVIFDLLKKRTSLGDALMMSVAQEHLSFVSTMVTWDNAHFENIFPGSVMTPEGFLRCFNSG